MGVQSVVPGMPVSCPHYQQYFHPAFVHLSAVKVKKSKLIKPDVCEHYDVRRRKEVKTLIPSLWLVPKRYNILIQR